MRISFLAKPASSFIKKFSIPFILENRKIIFQFIFTLFFIAIGIWFVKHDRAELVQVQDVLSSSDTSWVLLGIGLTIVYIILQALMYITSFASIGSKIVLKDAVILFLKRNFVSVFLPAGGISSLAFFSRDIESKGVTKTQIHFASSIYAFIGIISVIIVAIPAFLFALFDGSLGISEWIGLGAIILLAGAIAGLYRSIQKQGQIYQWIIKIYPPAEVYIIDLSNNAIDRRNFLYTILTSILIEIIGIAHLYIAMIALHYPPSLFAAVMGYIISVIFLIISPFLRGLGAIEVSMAFLLSRFGFTTIESIAITFLYRFLEFWLPLIAGLFSFMVHVSKLLMRIIPALLLLILGIINIISVLTPAIHWRVKILLYYLPMDALTASNYFVFAAGLFLLVTAAFMLKGLRTAWYCALGLSFISLIGHLAKAIDYEEAILAMGVIIILIISRKEYYIKTDPRLRVLGIKTMLMSVLAVFIYGIVGFYFLDKKHFNINFSISESITYTLQNFFLISDLIPEDKFARNFMYSINISGFLSMAFLIYTFVRPYVVEDEASEEDLEKARLLLNSYGNSALDYFKLYSDKLIFIPADADAFISYRISGNFAVVLEGPVSSNAEEMRSCILSFELNCYKNGLKSLYYRVPEEALEIYSELGKKKLFLGQEGILDLTTFSLEGGSKKSIRNALKKVTDRDFKAVIHIPPVKDGILQQIKSVSDEWLNETERSEIVFSQGMFVWEELKQQVIITVENPEHKVVAFLNIIPDFAKGEATYDLVRKTSDAPNGVMDYIMIELFNYLKSEKYTHVNLGFAPFSGSAETNTIPDRSIKFAYEKIRAFSHYKGMRDFKEKFAPEWHNKYLIYDNDYDLLQVPAVLTNVIKP